MTEEEKKETEEKVNEDSNIADLLGMAMPPEIRTLALFDDVDSEKAAEIVLGLIILSDKSLDPIDFYISTYGGSADDMFSMYDVMNLVKRKGVVVNTYGLGKVMSAGVLLLASGSPGHRKIGKHCRVMIHSCNAGNVGDFHNLKNEMEAISNLQDTYIEALVNETSLTKRQLKKILERKVNVYLTAQEALEYGIADEII